MPHRKRPAHQPVYIGRKPTIIFVTICAKDRRPILACDSFRDALLDAWHAHSGYVIGKYVLMPDHMHFFCAPGSWDALDLKSWIETWKGRASFNWKEKPCRGFLQTEFWDTKLRSGESYSAKWEYVRMNPVRQGLVERPSDCPYQGELNELWW